MALAVNFSKGIQFLYKPPEMLADAERERRVKSNFVETTVSDYNQLSFMVKALSSLVIKKDFGPFYGCRFPNYFSGIKI